MSSIRGTIIENTSSSGTLTQIPFFPKHEVELDSHKKVIPYPGKEHIERVLEEYSHQVKDLQKRLNEVSFILSFQSLKPFGEDSEAQCLGIEPKLCRRKPLTMDLLVKLVN